MQASLLRSLSRMMVAFCALGVGTAALAQTTASGTPSSAPTPAAPALNQNNPSRVDVFLGYSYLAPHGSLKNQLFGNTPFSSVDYGAIGSATYFFNKYFGAQLELAAHPNGKNDDFYTGGIGPVFRFPLQDVTPFAHATVGAVRGDGPRSLPFRYGPALVVGGGMDYATPFFGGKLGLRLFQADYEYMHLNFGPVTQPSGGRANLNAARLSTGLLLHLGSIIPPPPVAYACVASPAAVYPGDPVTVTGTATNLNPKKTATYSWSSTGGKVSGTSNTTTVDTNGMDPGSFTVTGHVTEGPKPGQSADCTATFTMQAFQPPTITCSANPTTVKPGDSSTVTSSGVSPQNRPLTYSYSASAGQISGTTNSASLATQGAPTGPITVTCTVTDDKGQTASATTTVNVEAPYVPPAPKSQKLCAIAFGRDTKRPARVDNEAKACLDDVALNAQRSADSKLVVVGEAGTDAKHGDKLAAQRAVNTKAYLVEEKGVDATRISVRTGPTGTDQAENYLVPAGAAFDTDVTGTTAVDETTVKVQSRKAPAPRKHHHAKKAAAAPAQ